MGGYPWRVGVLNANGALVGAGVLLSGRHVLTCAHVVARADTGEPRPEIGVEFVGLPEQAPGIARVLNDCWFPADEAQCGDIALLELDQAVPEPEGVRPVLRTISVWHRPVKVQGYPHGNAVLAEWVTAYVVGPGGPRNEWVQLDPHQSAGPRVRSGFSGAGVVDQATDAVIGLVVAASASQDSEVAWMMPLDTIAGYLPLVADRMVGDPAADRRFREKAEDQLAGASDPGREEANEAVVELLPAIADWLDPAARGVVANEDILLHQSGPQIYQNWADSMLSWQSTDSAPLKALQAWGDIIANGENLDGGTEGALLTPFDDAAKPLFTAQPGCYLDHTTYQDNSANTLRPGIDFDFFPFPAVGSGFSDQYEVSADFAAMFKQNPQAEKLMRFLASDDAQKIWPAVPGSGSFSADRNVRPEVYPDEVSRRIAQILTQAHTVCFDASDLMPASLSDAFNQAVLAYVSDPVRYRDPANAHALLANLDNVAAQARADGGTLTYQCGQS